MNFEEVDQQGATLQVHPYVISHWSVPSERFRWRVEVPKAGVYLPGGDFSGRETTLMVTVLETGQSVEITCRETGSWGSSSALSGFAKKPFEFDQAGVYTLEFQPAHSGHWRPVNIYACGLVEGTNPPTRRLVERLVDRFSGFA